MPSPVINSILDTDPVQVITGVNVMPKPNGLTITFDTRKGSMPVVTLWELVTGDPSLDMVPQNQAEASWGAVSGIQFHHTVNFTRLKQKTCYWFRIHAGDDENRVSFTPPVPAEFVDKACTLARECLLDFQNIKVWWTGDPDGGALMNFAMTVYNGANSIGEGLMDPAFLDVDSVDNSDVLTYPFGRSYVNIQSAPDVIVPYVSGTHEADKELIFTEIPDTVPSSQSKGSDDGVDWADVLTSLTLPDALGTSDWQSFSLGTGMAPVVFDVNVAFQTTVSDPLGALKMWPKKVTRINLPSQIVLRSAMPRVLRAGKRLVSFRLGPGGEIYRGLGRGRNLIWDCQGGKELRMMIALSHGEGAIDLVAQDGSKMLWTTHLAEATSPMVNWRELGLSASAEPTVQRGPDGSVEVLALDEKGRLQWRALHDGSPKGDWADLGGPFEGRAVAANIGGRLQVAIRGPHGKVCYRAAAGGSEDWRNVTAPVDLLLSMIPTEGGKAMIVGMDDKRKIHTLVLGNEEWDPIGTPEELLKGAAEPAADVFHGKSGTFDKPWWRTVR